MTKIENKLLVLAELARKQVIFSQNNVENFDEKDDGEDLTKRLQEDKNEPAITSI